MKVLSLFDGCSCGRIALDRAGIKVDKYYASEINKYAISVSSKNYPDIIRMGDVENWRDWDIDFSSIDLIIGGSPCTGFSKAGRSLNFNDPQSRLFFDYVDILNHVKKVNPLVRFLLENVVMKKDYEALISEVLGIKPIQIDSALVSAQRRRRLYWCNWDVQQPLDEGILLSDILISGSVDREKSLCLTSSYRKGTNEANYHKRKDRQIVYTDTIPLQAEVTHMWQRGHGFNKGGVRALQGKTTTLTSHAYEHNNFVHAAGEKGYRKLSPIECERLQTIPEGFTDCVSNSQRYKMIGNGWTVDVIAHLFSTLPLSRMLGVQQLSLSDMV